MMRISDPASWHASLLVNGEKYCVVDAGHVSNGKRFVRRYTQKQENQKAIMQETQHTGLPSFQKDIVSRGVAVVYLPLDSTRLQCLH